MALRQYSGNAQPTTLAGGITAAATTFDVADGTNYPDGSVGPFVVTVDNGLSSEEKILCSSRTGNSFTVATGGRGWDSTAAAAHDNQAVVAHTFSANDAREANAHVNDTTGDPHPQYRLESTAVTAAEITYAGSTNLTSTNVEAALDELDAEKVRGTVGLTVATTAPTAPATNDLWVDIA